mmetsp:Transcript_4810/g.18023  ORF Transcript_4810/g.18023 Transcript_4810/m.18023 type:complete len:253 (+) Transcript_4810:407-1165(+)
MHASRLNHTSPRHVALRNSQYASCIIASSYAHPGAGKYRSFRDAIASRSNGKCSSDRSMSASALTNLGSRSSYVSGSSASSSNGVEEFASSWRFRSSEAASSSTAACASAALVASKSSTASAASASASASTSASSSSITSASAFASFSFSFADSSAAPASSPSAAAASSPASAPPASPAPSSRRSRPDVRLRPPAADDGARYSKPPPAYQAAYAARAAAASASSTHPPCVENPTERIAPGTISLVLATNAVG